MSSRSVQVKATQTVTVTPALICDAFHAAGDALFDVEVWDRYVEDLGGDAGEWAEDVALLLRPETITWMMAVVACRHDVPDSTP